MLFQLCIIAIERKKTNNIPHAWERLFFHLPVDTQTTQIIGNYFGRASSTKANWLSKALMEKWDSWLMAISLNMMHTKKGPTKFLIGWCLQSVIMRPTTVSDLFTVTFLASNKNLMHVSVLRIYLHFHFYTWLTQIQQWDMMNQLFFIFTEYLLSHTTPGIT